MIFLTALFLTKYSIRTKELVELNNDFESYKELQASQYKQLENEYNLVITEYEKIYQENKRLSETNTTLEKLIKMQSDKLVNHKGNGCEPIVEKIETVTVSSSIIDEPYIEENNVPQEQPQIEDNSSEDTPTNEGMTFVGYYELTAYRQDKSYGRGHCGTAMGLYRRGTGKAYHRQRPPQRLATGGMQRMQEIPPQPNGKDHLHPYRDPQRENPKPHRESTCKRDESRTRRDHRRPRQAIPTLETKITTVAQHLEISISQPASREAVRLQALFHHRRNYDVHLFLPKTFRLRTTCHHGIPAVDHS